MATKLGVGFRVTKNALSKIEQSGGVNPVSVTFNHNVTPFTTDGTRLKNLDTEELRRLEIERYKGGEERYGSYVPQGDYTESGTFRKSRVLNGLLAAWQDGFDVNSLLPHIFYFEGSPNDYAIGAWPTHQEATDYQYVVTRRESEDLFNHLRQMGYIEKGETDPNSRPQRNRPDRKPEREPNSKPNSTPDSNPTVPLVVPPAIPPSPSTPPSPLSSVDLQRLTDLLEEVKAALETLQAVQTHQGEQLAVLVRRSKPQGSQREGTSVGEGGVRTRGEVKRKNKPT